MIHGPSTPLEARSNRDIIVTMIAFIVLGSVIIIGTLGVTLPGGNLFTTILGTGGSCFVAGIVLGTVRAGIMELRRRKTGAAQNERVRASRFNILKWSSWATLALPLVAYIVCSEVSTRQLFFHAPPWGHNVNRLRFDAFLTSAIISALILLVTVALKRWRWLIFPLVALMLTYLLYVQASWFTTFLD